MKNAREKERKSEFARRGKPKGSQTHRLNIFRGSSTLSRASFYEAGL